MCRLQTTFNPDPAGLKASLSQNPLLAVLRPSSTEQAQRQVAAVAAIGFKHIELAWNSAPWWAQALAKLQKQWPNLLFGAAGIRAEDQILEIAAFGLKYAMAPIASNSLLNSAREQGITLVPGVFSPTEIHHFAVGGIVKLFPAAALGPNYWRYLQGPMAPLPFCIAAGGIAPTEVAGWFEAGVQAVALGSSLFDPFDCLLPQHANALEPFANITTNAN
jgi:2-dehydro-3-deoxyphosphogluconate aldolase/(4S)-4-hydroxy-2-oxoglutarate aldolase